MKISSRPVIAFVCALLAHGGAGWWAVRALQPRELTPFVDAAPAVEVELTAPPEAPSALEQPPETTPPPAPDTPTEPTPPAMEETPAPPPEPAPQPDPEPAPQPKPEPKPVRKASPDPAQRKALTATQPASPRPGPMPKASPGGTGPNIAPSASAGPTAGPVCVSRPTPPYPSAMLSRRIAGTVTVAISIDSGGHVTDTSVSVSSGQDALDSAACAGVRRWKFRPATQRGVPVASLTRVNVVFRPK